MRELPPRAWRCVLVLGSLLAATLPAQVDPAAAMERFTSSFTRAVQLVERGRPRDLRDATSELDTCAALVRELPEARREQARFFVAVRQADLWIRSPDAGVRDRVLPGLLQAREDARASDAYDGSYRVLLHVLARQVDPGWLRGLAEDERDFLMQEDLFEDELGRAKYLHAPARLLRFELGLDTEHEVEELRALHRLERDLATESEGRVWHTECLGALVDYYAQRRDFERARLFVDRMPEEDGRLLRALLALQREDHATAESEARRVASAGDAQGLLLLGEALEAQGRAEEGLEAYERFLDGDPDERNRAAALNGRGDCLLQHGRLDEAERSYRSVLELAREGSLGLRAEAAETWKDLGRVAERRGDGAAAWDTYRRALELQERLRGGVLSDAFGATWLAAHPDQLTAVDGMLRVAESAGADAWELLAATERFKARSALDGVRRGYGPSEAEAVRGVMDRLASAKDADDLGDVLLELGILRAGLGKRDDEPSEPLDAAGLRAFASGRPGTLVLSYWVGREQSRVLWSLGGSAPRVVLLGDTAAALRHTGAAFGVVLDPHSDTAPLAEAAAFFLPDGLRAEIERADDLLISPDTEIARLPFEALPVGGEPLGWRHVVERAPSLSVAQALQERAPAEGLPVLLHSASNEDLEAVLQLEPLVFSEREAELVRGELVELVGLSGGGASLTGLRAMLSSAPSVMHLSAHAVDLPMVPSCSLLVLSDGAVSMASLSALPLQGSLIVLSSCDSAVGELRRQEGVVGLVEGAMAAGARAVVASLYRVNQQATADLMGQFYHRLQRGDSPPAAMTAARSALGRNAHYAHPHYWAGFTVHGGWSPPRAGMPLILWLALGAALLLLVLWSLARSRTS